MLTCGRPEPALRNSRAKMGRMSENPELLCPECGSEHHYETGALVACSLCGHEWNPEEVAAAQVTRDAVGNILVDGDDVTVVRDLKVKGAREPIKAGTKVRDIRLVEPVDGHDIDCRVDGFGRMKLKSEVVKKA